MSDQTVFVVGAGASTDVGFPVGNVFKYQVADKIAVVDEERGYPRLADYEIHSVIEQLSAVNDENVPIETYFNSSQKIINSTPAATSIDSVLEIHQDDDIAIMIGKTAIVRSILEAEFNSDLMIDPERRETSIDLAALEKTWYMHLLRLLCGSLPFHRLESRFENVTLIVFNYDRCIEHFLFHALQQHYGQKPEDVVNLLRHLKIFHPYGTVGSLPWEGQSTSVAYGRTKVSGILLELSRGLYTYNEAVEAEEGEKIHAIRYVLQRAAKIIFLGYAFHRQNMRLIKPEDRGNAWFIASSNFDNSASNCELIRRELTGSYCPGDKEAIHYGQKLDCSGIFTEYERTLA